MDQKGLVFKIQRYSLHDGPGIRTLVFLKGCSLHCLWCFNPESQEQKIEIIHYPVVCIGCNSCAGVCPISGCINLESVEHKIDKALCTNCGSCVDACPSGAARQVGMLMDAGAVAEIVEKDKAFYEKSGGGVTITGGEAAVQPEFAAAILQQCRERGIHTAVETSGYCSWENMEVILAHTDLVLYDLKGMDRQKHKFYTGVDNSLILENARHIAGQGYNMIIRIPVIPGCMDDPGELKVAAKFIAEELEPVKDVHLLPYKFFGVSKYKRLGKEYRLGDVEPPSAEVMSELQKIFSSFLLRCQVGG